MNRQGITTAILTTAAAGAAIYGISKGVKNGTFQRLPQQLSNMMNNQTVQQITNSVQNMGNNQNMQQLTNAIGTENSEQQETNNINNLS